jgi:hypothetical protein
MAVSRADAKRLAAGRTATVVHMTPDASISTTSICLNNSIAVSWQGVHGERQASLHGQCRVAIALRQGHPALVRGRHIRSQGVVWRLFVIPMTRPS